MTLPASGPLAMTDIQTEFGGTNPIGLNEYYAGGGLVPAGTSGTYGAVPSSGALSIQNFYGTSQVIPVYIEEVFSTYLYTGNGSTQTITNGIDLAGEGGLVWTKGRSDAQPNSLFDTARGATKQLVSSSIDPTNTAATSLTAFNSNGFSLGTYGDVNSNGTTMVSWTFRKQPKFFDVVTWSGNGVTGRQIAHNLGSVPGCIIVKNTSLTTGWYVYHRSLGASQAIRLEEAQPAGGTSVWDSTAPTSTVFTVNNSTVVNASGSNYVAYIFAHDAGGFGLTGTDNVISCGSYSGNASIKNINLGYEPQWIMIKSVGLSGPYWYMFDTMRGWNATGDDLFLAANRSNAEANFRTTISGDNFGEPTSTGFTLSTTSGAVNGNGQDYIYIAIRRGPMEVPTLGTSVYGASFGNATKPWFQNTGWPVDMLIQRNRGGGSNTEVGSRLMQERSLKTNNTSEEAIGTNYDFDYMNGAYNLAFADTTYIGWMFRRAPSFFDVVCYAGTNTDNSNKAHNLGVAPELIILKTRSEPGAPYNNWYTWQKDITEDKYLYLNTASAEITAPNPTFGPFGTYAQMTATTWRVQNAGLIDRAGDTYVAYLFASCPGVSKVGSYTGTAATLQINCGFTTGARFVLIKRTDSTGDWYYWDSTRGIVAGNDPYLLLNSQDAEVTSTDYVDTYSAGFEITSTAPAAINASGGTFIFLAIA